MASIHGDAFSGCSSLTEFIVQEDNQTYRSIDGNLYRFNGEELFRYAPGKTDRSFDIPGGVTRIGDSAFSDIASLENIVIPESVTSVGKYAFSNCSSLEEMTIPKSVTEIGLSAFVGCSSLAEFIVQEGNQTYQSIDGNLYNGDGTQLIAYAGGKTNASFTIPGGVTDIGSSAFESCSSLENVIIPEGVINIGWYAFYNCAALESVVIPDSVVCVGADAFGNCTALADIRIGTGVVFLWENSFRNTAYSNHSDNRENGVLYIGDYLIQADDGVSGQYRVKEGTRAIACFAFHWCRTLTDVYIPDSVSGIGCYAFMDCAALENVTFENAEGWYWTGAANASGGRRFSYEDLSDSSAAAGNLVTEYYNYFWYKTGE